jgi:hypothetical protein
MRFLQPALVAVLCLGATSAALARGRREVHSRVDLTTGTVTMLAAPSTAVTALTTPRAAASWVASDDAGVVTVRTAGGKDPLRLAVGKLAYEWMPWSAFQPGLFLFDWRERVVVPGKPDVPRRARAVDLATGAELAARTTGAARRRPPLCTGAGFDRRQPQEARRHLARRCGAQRPTAGGETLTMLARSSPGSMAPSPGTSTTSARWCRSLRSASWRRDIAGSRHPAAPLPGDGRAGGRDEVAARRPRSGRRQAAVGAASSGASC